jgi:hypothetical protein
MDSDWLPLKTPFLFFEDPARILEGSSVTYNAEMTSLATTSKIMDDTAAASDEEQMAEYYDEVLKKSYSLTTDNTCDLCTRTDREEEVSMMNF